MAQGISVFSPNRADAIPVFGFQSQVRGQRVEFGPHVYWFCISQDRMEALVLESVAGCSLVLDLLAKLFFDSLECLLILLFRGTDSLIVNGVNETLEQAAKC